VFGLVTNFRFARHCFYNTKRPLDSSVDLVTQNVFLHAVKGV